MILILEEIRQVKGGVKIKGGLVVLNFTEELGLTRKITNNFVMKYNILGYLFGYICNNIYRQ